MLNCAHACMSETAHPGSGRTRQVGKTTILRQVLESIDQPVTYADEQNLKGSHWIAQQWDAARLVARQSKHYYREGTHVALQL